MVDCKRKQMNSLVAPVFNPVDQCAANATAWFRQARKELRQLRGLRIERDEAQNFIACFGHHDFVCRNDLKNPALPPLGFRMRMDEPGSDCMPSLEPDIHDRLQIGFAIVADKHRVTPDVPYHLL